MDCVPERQIYEGNFDLAEIEISVEVVNGSNFTELCDMTTLPSDDTTTHEDVIFTSRSDADSKSDDNSTTTTTVSDSESREYITRVLATVLILIVIILIVVIVGICYKLHQKKKSSEAVRYSAENGNDSKVNIQRTSHTHVDVDTVSIVLDLYCKLITTWDTINVHAIISKPFSMLYNMHFKASV